MIAPEALAAVRADLQAARDRAGAKLDHGLRGVEAARLYAVAADQAVRALWEIAMGEAPARLSLLAVGGYGRGVLAPFSDLDLMILRPGKPEPAGDLAVEAFLHALWDLGFKIGWAVRSRAEALKLAREDMTIRTTLLEARHLAGDEALSGSFLARFRREVKKADPRAFIAAKLDERDVRHRKAGTVRYQVEPNVKDGKGGLRDLNSLFWIARSLSPDSPLGEATLEGLLTAKERRLAVQAFDFLWAVRIHMHRLAGRAEDRLTFELQPEVAERMGWSGRGEAPAVERFMRRYFVIARDVGALTRAMSAKLEAQHAKAPGGLMRFLPLPGRARTRKSAVEGVVEEAGRLTVADPRVLSDHPLRMLELFREADRLGLDLHPDAFGAVARSLDRISPSLRRDPEAARAFLDVLAHGQRPYRTLSLMNEAGLLGRFLPEFARVVGQTQFNRYHAYTVDEHTLQAVGILRDIETGALKDDHPLSHAVFPLIADREALYLAMLLHDVGKGGARGQLEDGAIAARRACERLGLEPARAGLVAWLVEHHLALSDFAQKRDTADPATIAAFADLAVDLERLRMLLVLTAADVRAVGPGVWNGWKGQLMRELYAATEARFRGEADAFDPAPPPTALMARAVKQGAAAALVHRPEWDTAELTFVARDRHGLFAEIASALAAEGADVTGARIRTTGDGWAFDVFQLQDGRGGPFALDDPRRSRRLERAVVEAALGQGRRGPAASETPRGSVFDVAPVVIFDNPPNAAATIVEASGRDRPGLLADLAHVLSDAGLTLRSAHIESHGARAVDAFYVTTRKGGLLTAAKDQDRVRAALMAALSRPAEAAPARKLARARASAAR